MADEANDKQVQVLVVSNYGPYKPGDRLAVTPREYDRVAQEVRDPETGRLIRVDHPVLITASDQEKMDALKKKQEAQRQKEQDDRVSKENGAAWADLERQSLERLQEGFRDRNGLPAAK